MSITITVGTRPSRLALKQVEEVGLQAQQKIHGIYFKVITIATDGDQDKTTAFSLREGSDFFTRQIDEALIKGDIDCAIHSAKDLADNLDERLSIAAITAPIDQHEVLISKGKCTLEQLPRGVIIGTSSQRRKEQLQKYRSDIKIVDIRGNIEERLALLGTAPHLDAIVIAAAGLIRLGLEHRITQRLCPLRFAPHPLQGRLAVLTRKDDIQLQKIFSVLDTRNKSEVGK